jgi:haloalkane dehalogenase
MASGKRSDTKVPDGTKALKLMSVLRTPKECFADLPDYPFVPRYHVMPDGVRMHYVDEGHSGAAAVLLLHEEPTWSYLYRRMIPPIVNAGFRVWAPDLIGFASIIPTGSHTPC